MEYITGINHVDFRVADVDAAVKFYCEGLGLGLIRRDDYNAIAATPDGVILEISPQGSSKGDTSGITHVCYNTYNVDAAFERALEYGACASRASDPVPYTYKDLRMAFVRTPFGEEIEFWSIQKPDGGFGEEIKDNKYISHFVHVALTVSDMPACVAFYEGLGAKLKVDWEWGCSMTLPDGREFELFCGGEYAKKAEGYTHMCLETPNVEAALARIVELGGEITHEPYDWSNLRIAFAKGLGGEIIELFSMYQDNREPDVFKASPDKLPDLFKDVPKEKAI